MAPALDGELQARGDAHLSEQHRQLVADRLFLDPKLRRDRAVGPSRTDFRDERLLARRQEIVGLARFGHRGRLTSRAAVLHRAGRSKAYDCVPFTVVEDVNG